MDDEYREFIKGSFADIQNIGSGKGGGPITGAWFIREFAGDTPWIHLDIAGTAWNDEAKPWLAKGPTGVALRTLVHSSTSDVGIVLCADLFEVVRAHIFSGVSMPRMFRARVICFSTNSVRRSRNARF